MSLRNNIFEFSLSFKTTNPAGTTNPKTKAANQIIRRFGLIGLLSPFAGSIMRMSDNVDANEIADSSLFSNKKV